jgi:hypothetical protein
MPNLTKICQMGRGAELTHAVIRTDGHAEANGSFYRLCGKCPLAFSLCEIWGSRSGNDVNSDLLGCCTVMTTDRWNTQHLFTFHPNGGYYLRVQKASHDTQDIFTYNQGRTRNLWLQRRGHSWLQQATVHVLSNTDQIMQQTANSL